MTKHEKNFVPIVSNAYTEDIVLLAIVDNISF